MPREVRKSAQSLAYKGLLPKPDMSVYPMFENSVGREVDLAVSCRPAGLRAPFALSPSTHVLGSAHGVPQSGTPKSRGGLMSRLCDGLRN